MDMLQILNFDDFILGGGLNVFIFISLLAYESVSHSVVPNSLQPHGLQPTRLLCLWDFSGKDTGVGCFFLLQRIFPTQGSNPGLLHYRQFLYRLGYEGNPIGVQMIYKILTVLN